LTQKREAREEDNKLKGEALQKYIKEEKKKVKNFLVD